MQRHFFQSLALRFVSLFIAFFSGINSTAVSGVNELIAAVEWLVKSEPYLNYE